MASAAPAFMKLRLSITHSSPVATTGLSQRQKSPAGRTFPLALPYGGAARQQQLNRPSLAFLLDEISPREPARVRARLKPDAADGFGDAVSERVSITFGGNGDLFGA